MQFMPLTNDFVRFTAIDGAVYVSNIDHPSPFHRANSRLAVPGR